MFFSNVLFSQFIHFPSSFLSYFLIRINLTLSFIVKLEFEMPPQSFWPIIGKLEALFFAGLVQSLKHSLFRLIAETFLSPAHFRSGAPPGLQSFYNFCLINLGPRRAHKSCLPLCCSFHEFSEFSPF